MSTANSATIDTPVGPFTAIVDSDGAVLGSGWTARTEELLPQIAPSVRPDSLRAVRDLGPVSTAVREYHRGQLDAIDAIPVRQQGGPFIEHAWQVLRGIGPGDPVTYSHFATLSGRPQAVRAAAAACARNAAALFVPCHRVLRIGGALGGFRWGLDVKRWLIEHESTR